MIFLSCTVNGMIASKASTVTRMTPGKELYRLESIGRLQPLVKGDDDSPCLVTFVNDPNLPSGRMVLLETYSEIMNRLKTVTL